MLLTVRLASSVYELASLTISIFLFFSFNSDFLKLFISFLVMNLFSCRFSNTKSLLNFASSGYLYGLYLLGAFGSAANRAASG